MGILPRMGSDLLQHGPVFADDNALVAGFLAVDGHVQINDPTVPLGELGEKAQLLEVMAAYSGAHEFDAIIPISAQEKDGLLGRPAMVIIAVFLISFIQVILNFLTFSGIERLTNLTPSSPSPPRRRTGWRS